MLAGVTAGKLRQSLVRRSEMRRHQMRHHRSLAKQRPLRVRCRGRAALLFVRTRHTNEGSVRRIGRLMNQNE